VAELVEVELFDGRLEEIFRGRAEHGRGSDPRDLTGPARGNGSAAAPDMRGRGTPRPRRGVSVAQTCEPKAQREGTRAKRACPARSGRRSKSMGAPGIEVGRQLID